MNRSLSIHIGESILENVVAHAQSALPQEACGLLIGQRSEHRAIVHSIQPAGNVATNPEMGFEIDPKVILHATRRQPQGEPILIGFYHSHPDGSSEPSVRDLKAAWPQMLYLIVTVAKGHPPHASVWHTTGPGLPFIRDELSTMPTELTVI